MVDRSPEEDVIGDTGHLAVFAWASGKWERGAPSTSQSLWEPEDSSGKLWVRPRD